MFQNGVNVFVVFLLTSRPLPTRSHKTFKIVSGEKFWQIPKCSKIKIFYFESWNIYISRFLQLDGEQKFLIDFALFSHSAVSTGARIEAAETYKEQFTNSPLGRNIHTDKEQMQLSNFTEWCQTKTAAEIANLKNVWTTVSGLNFVIY